MYAEWTVLYVKPEHKEELSKMLPQFVAMHESLKGYISQTFIMDEGSGEFACLSIWETKEDLDASVAACMPEVQKASALFAKEPALKVYEVMHMSQKK